MANFNRDQLERIERKYRAFLEQTETAFNDLGGREAAERYSVENESPDSGDISKHGLVEVIWDAASFLPGYGDAGDTTADCSGGPGKPRLWTNDQERVREREFTKRTLLEVFGRMISDLRSGGLGNLMNFLHNRDFFVGIERLDSEGLSKFFAQLPDQSPQTLDEIEQILGEWITAFAPHFQASTKLAE